MKLFKNVTGVCFFKHSVVAFEKQKLVTL